MLCQQITMFCGVFTANWQEHIGISDDTIWVSQLSKKIKRKDATYEYPDSICGDVVNER